MRTTVVRAMRKFLRSWDSCLEFSGGCDASFLTLIGFTKSVSCFIEIVTLRTEVLVLQSRIAGIMITTKGAILGEVAK